jgi:hypothetical protein
MKDKIKNTLKQFNIDYCDFDFSRSEDSIIDQIEEYLISSSQSVKTTRLIMDNLWQLQRRSNESIYFNTDNFKRKRKEILANSSYQINEEWIECNKFIGCTAIKTNDGFHILNDKQIDEINSLGYGISQYKLILAPVIRNVYCVGKHPNVCSFTNSLCISDFLKNAELSLDNLKVIEESLSQFNLVSSFLNKHDFQNIMGVLNDE